MSEAPERIFITGANGSGSWNAKKATSRAFPKETEYVRADHIEQLETLIKDFFILLDKTEETDEGRVFRPNRISSCRVQDGQMLDNLLRLMKTTVEDRQK